MPPRRERVDDPRERHVGPLPRPERVEVADDDAVEAELAPIRVCELLAGELADPVGRERVRRRLLGRRIPLGGAVDGRGRREHDLDPVARGRLEDPLRGEHVPAEVEREDVAEAAHARLPGEMEDAVEAGEVERILGQVDVADVEPARVLVLERRVVVVGEAVEADDLVAAGLQRFARGASR